MPQRMLTLRFPGEFFSIYVAPNRRGVVWEPPW
jgi:hypothetical protein